MPILDFLDKRPKDTTSNLSAKEFARYFDHTNLKPTARLEDIQVLCDEAGEFGFAAVCVASRWVSYAATRLRESSVSVCTVVGFPHGNSMTAVKCFEAERAVEEGATEIDMVLSIGDLKARRDNIVVEDIRAVVDSVAATDAVVKVILETGYLSESQIVRACKLSQSGGAHFVKTSTGFGPSGADPDSVRLMRESVDGNVGVKAAGGIRTLDDATTMIEAGASRLGCSSSVAIVEELVSKLGAQQHVRQGN